MGRDVGSYLDGIGRFQRDVFPELSENFEALAGGQRPGLLLVTCSDSRIDPALVTQTQPGELFVIRNAGNIVPAADAGPGGEAGTVEFAIEGLGIRHIAVMGHSRCGAMAALVNEEATAELPALRGWLEHARGALARVDAIRGLEDPALRVVAANVLAQIENLRSHPSVASALERGALELHGWIYRFETGEVQRVAPGGRVGPLVDESAPARASA